MADIKFRKVSDSLVEVLYDGVMNIVSKEDAVQMGYTEITYQGEPITYASFARIIGKRSSNIQRTVRRRGFTTGEQIIEYYRKIKSFTYQGKPITIPAFAKLIDKTDKAVESIIYRCNYHTGEEVIRHYNNKYTFTYQGKSITYDDFAKIIDKQSATIRKIANKYNFTTGEQVIEFYKKHNENKKLTYQGKPITYTDFAKIMGKSFNNVQHAAQKYNYTTGEQIIEHYRKLEQGKSLTYQGKPISCAGFAKLINKNCTTIYNIIRKYGYTTGEEVIEHLKNLEQDKMLTYQGKPISCAGFAKLINKSCSTIYNIICKNGYTTGEEIIGHLKNVEQDELLTYQGKTMNCADFAKLIDKCSSTITDLVHRYCYTTGEQVIEHYRKLKQNKSFTYQGESIACIDFAKRINKNYGAVLRIVNTHGYTTGEEVIEHYRKRGSFTYQGKPITKTDFAKIINKKCVTINDTISRYGYTTGEEVIEHYRLRGKL